MVDRMSGQYLGIDESRLGVGGGWLGWGEGAGMGVGVSGAGLGGWTGLVQGGLGSVRLAPRRQHGRLGVGGAGWGGKRGDGVCGFGA
ncbi:hypothetical protein PIB30_098671 [Stylosanthes scabra]|uniref:Uncharacterized protein n=1 Tax=Stylosanthes scabra TaxID=79078 RepID=A0ABU6WV21_9FABA|nr:hypothetical protein [Stylosanthes scabra]